MTTNGAPVGQPTVLGRLDSPSARVLVRLAATFEDLQTVLRSCEHLVAALGSGPDERDDVVIEALWTVALLSYARCFSGTAADGALSDDDVATAVSGGQSGTDAQEWHRVLLRLREHQVDPTENPREQFSVGVAQDADGAAEGIAITSARQPLVDDVTVRQTGAVAYALSGLVDERIAAQQQRVFGEVKDRPAAELARLPRLDVVPSE